MRAARGVHALIRSGRRSPPRTRTSGPGKTARDQPWMNFTVETGHWPSCPLIDMRSPCTSSRKTCSIVAKVPVEATAYPQRQCHFVKNVHTRWREHADDAACIAWACELFDATAPYAAGSVYVNFMPDDEVGRVSAAYGPNIQRLAQIKHRYDPTNLFRMNHNIAPASSASAAA